MWIAWRLVYLFSNDKYLLRRKRALCMTITYERKGKTIPWIYYDIHGRTIDEARQIFGCLFLLTRFTTQVDCYELRIRSYTTVYGVVYGRIHTIYAPYTTVFLRNTWSRITIVYFRDRIRRYTEKYGDRKRRVYDRKRSYLSRLRS